MSKLSNHKQMLKKTTDDWDDSYPDSFWNSYRKISYKFKDDDTVNTVELTRFQYENFRMLPIIEYCKIEKVSHHKISEQLLMGVTVP